VVDLDKRPAHTLTDRECAKLLGSLLGGMLGMSSLENVRAAIEWWAKHPEAIDALHGTIEKMQTAAAEALQTAAVEAWKGVRR